MINLLTRKRFLLACCLLTMLLFVVIGCTKTTQPLITDSAGAREAVINYLNDQYSENIPVKKLSWLEADKTPQGMVGSAVKEYTAESWLMRVIYPIVKPEATVYTIWLVNNDTGWKWEGKVSANANIEETRPLKQITEEESRQIAGDFVKNEATFKFDGIEDTFKYVQTTVLRTPFAWQFTFEFQSRHGGYGDRTGQMLDLAITPHTAVITVIRAQVTSAKMDEKWDMIAQRLINEVEIKAAPIHEVTFNFMESYPVQVGAQIKGGLSDGCTTFHDAVVTREGDTISISVTVQRPKDRVCPAIYTYFEENLNLGSDFASGKTYTVKVNDYTTSFVYP